jgi:hypothetical protein
MNRRKKYPKLTVDRAEQSALIYLRMKRAKQFIWRTTDIEDHNSSNYTRVLQEMHRLEDNGILGRTTVGDSGNIWWLKERTIDG